MTKDEAFARLGKSKFRSRFKLTAEDLAYIDRVGLATIQWWKVRKGRPLSDAQQRKAVDFLMAWIGREAARLVCLRPR